MKVGDLVRHKKKGWIGRILDFMKRNPGVLVDLSDERGVKVRWIHRDNLEVINEEV
jgi:hypothetical protein